MVSITLVAITLCLVALTTGQKYTTQRTTTPYRAVDGPPFGPPGNRARPGAGRGSVFRSGVTTPSTVGGYQPDARGKSGIRLPVSPPTDFPVQGNRPGAGHVDPNKRGGYPNPAASQPRRRTGNPDSASRPEQRPGAVDPDKFRTGAPGAGGGYPHHGSPPGQEPPYVDPRTNQRQQGPRGVDPRTGFRPSFPGDGDGFPNPGNRPRQGPDNRNPANPQSQQPGGADPQTVYVPGSQSGNPNTGNSRSPPVRPQQRFFPDGRGAQPRPAIQPPVYPPGQPGQRRPAIQPPLYPPGQPGQRRPAIQPPLYPPGQPGQRRPAIQQPLFQPGQPGQQRPAIQQPFYPPGQPGQPRPAIQQPFFPPGQPGQPRPAIQQPFYPPGQPGQQRPAIQQPFFPPGQPGQQRPAIQQPFYPPSQPGQQRPAIQQPFFPPSQPGQQRPSIQPPRFPSDRKDPNIVDNYDMPDRARPNTVPGGDQRPNVPFDPWQRNGYRNYDYRYATPDDVIAFSGSSRSSQTFNKPSKVMFDDVLTNIGGAFNYRYGVFTAPVSGIYIIHYHAASSGKTGKPAILDLLRNDRVVNSARAKGAYGMASNSAILFLSRYDRLSVQGRTGTSIFCETGHSFCSFNVALLRLGMFSRNTYPRGFPLPQYNF